IREASKRYTSGELETHYISQRISTKSVWPEAVYTLSAAFILTCLYIFYFAVLILVSLRIVCMFLLLGFSKIKDARRISTHRYNDGVSVLIPAYNEEENIESTIKSVVFNDYQKKEIIVVDDGSTDSTARIVAHLAVVYSGIKLIRTPNNGKATAIRIGMEVSTFDVCVIMDADTIFKKNTISKLVARFWDRKVGAVAGKIATARSRSFIDVLQRIEYIVGQNIDKMAFGGVNAINVVPGPVGAWRKSAVRSVGGPSQDTLVEDQDLTLALLEAGYRVEYEPRAIAFTETPHTFRDFLKQRFRWIYGSIQCVWKYKRSLIRKPFSSLSLIIIPNTLIFGFLIPLFSPLIDITLVASVMLGQSEHVIMPYIVFTALDFIYALFAFIPEKKDRLKVFLIPIQRLYYRQVMYYVVLVGIIRALEGTGALWGKVRKIGESQKLYLTDEHQLDNV
ncbi:MAG TPA: glycosyltransferase family 2 protein, partial [Candidatus Paceibacterota bacterium]